ncbi:RHS domain-containing protein [Aureitalea sp. L0-47]|uniref:DUF6531 domain-containing protein n=1 Tax=Aureitalea sp. L0-47 TaxID=2816962 RepID=UPI0022389300|nr:DUF6531 domain-containing protein [Aureitalea sp. L0-47]MCW5518549.1 RHS domain-containing protein [Aureitalea sp. L0-47]
MDPIVGVDIHIVMIPTPAGPVPTPLPHPFVGMVMDPMDYIPVVGATIMINKMPRGNATTAGMLGSKVHIPMGGPFQMAPTIGHDSVNFFGSPRVVADGSYMSASGFMVMSCNDVGMPLTAAPGKKMKPKPGFYLPSSATIPIPKGPPIMVGGPYVPDLMAIVMSLAMSYGMGSAMKAAGKGLKKLNHAVLKKFPATKGLSKKLCKMGFEPVDLITGRMVYEGVDFEIPGIIPVSWERNWYSDSEYEGWLGHGVSCNYDTALHLMPDDDAIVMRLPDGRVTTFPLLIAEGDSYYDRMEKKTITCVDSHTYTVRDHESNLINTFKRINNNLYRPESISNTDGFAIQFFYNAVGKLEQMVDTAGRRIDFELDREGRITKVTAKHNGSKRKLVEYSYNESGDLIGITDALDQTTKMEYENHLMVKKTDRNGQSFYWEYDGKKTGAKCIKTWGDGGILAGTIEYGKGKNIVTNSLGHETIYYFDENNLCTQVTDPEGGHVFHQYTDYMEPYRDIDEVGNITGYSYDDRGNLTGLHAPDGTVATFIYDDEDRVILIKPPDGGSSTKVYDEDKLIATIAPSGAMTSYAYNDKGLLHTITDNAGNTTHLLYDADLNLEKTIVNGEKRASWRYDAWGRVLETNNSEKYRQQYYYDALDRVTQIQKADKSAIRFKYNAYQDIIETLDSKKHKIKFDYTPIGSLKNREENGVKVEFKHNTEDQLVAIVNEHKEYYRFGRNDKGEIINETGFDGLRKDFIRDQAGKVLRVSRPGERFTEFEYDLNGKITRTEHYDGSWETFSYDGNGSLVEAVNQNSKVLLTYDDGGKIITENQDGYMVESIYDELGDRIQVKSSLGANIEIERNSLGYVKGMSGEVGESGKQWKTTVKTNSLGMEVERVLPGGIKTKFEYDSAGRPIAQTVHRGSDSLRHRTYSWNVNDQLRKMVNELSSGVVTYTHDDFGNLASARYEDNQFDYKLPDEVGNIFRDKGQSDRKYGPGGKLREANGNTYRYDPEGNLITKITSKGNWEYKWYGNGMLKSVNKPDGSHVAFEYDALGRRTAKIVSPRMGNKEKTIHRWVWDGNVPLHEWRYGLHNRPKWVVDEFGELTRDKEEPVSDLITWMFEDRSFRPTAKIVAGEQYSIVTDYLGTPVEMYDSKGTKTWEAEYDIYGKIRKLTKGSLSDCPFRYQGQYEDVETGLYYNRFRYYAAEEGLYISQDPIGLMGGMSLYSYSKDTSLFVDPFGLEPISLQEALDQANDFLEPGEKVRVIDNPNSSGVQWIQVYEKDGVKVTKRVGFDINPESGHVKKLGPHLNLQTQFDGKIQGGDLADPHTKIDPGSIDAVDPDDLLNPKPKCG